MATRTPVLDTLLELSLGSPIGQCRAVPVCLGDGAPRAVLAVYGADFDVDPWVEMFFFPTDTLRLALFTETGDLLWRRDLGRAVVPGMWFCPVFPFDLDGDGADEIWFVNNLNPQHPLGLSHYRLERLDASSGRTTGQWPWPNLGRAQSLSHTFRNFLLGGFARGEPVLVTAQGTYEDMYLQGWRPGMESRWEVAIAADAPGARGSHMCPVVDIDGDGVDEVLWGERCLSLDDGGERFCADRDVYRGHSDIVQPVLDRDTGRWFLYTCREGDPRATPRVVLFDDAGRRIWGEVAQGHMDMGWVARLGDGDQHVAMAIRIDHKTCGPDGRFHYGQEEFTFDALTGAPYPLPFRVYGTLPVDLDGDGLHELVRGLPGGDGAVLDREGRSLGSVGGPVALACRFLDHPGEQILTYAPDGTLRVWGDRNAEDSPAAQARYAHPFYAANRRLMSSGANLVALGGL
jgi:hypothetical protein